MRYTEELFDLAAREGIRVWFTRLAPAYAGLYIRKPGLPPSIALDLDLHRHERLLRAVLAEELGHHFTTAGEWVKAASSTRERVALSRTEQRALRWAEDYLMPDPEFA